MITWCIYLHELGLWKAVWYVAWRNVYVFCKLEGIHMKVIYFIHTLCAWSTTLLRLYCKKVDQKG